MCEQFDKGGVVCPVLLRHNVFTTFVVDNIDHNPGSRTAVDSWHGISAISATPHPTGATDGLKREQPEFALRTQKQLCKLPLSYTNVKPYLLKVKDIYTPPQKDTGPNMMVSLQYSFFSDMNIYSILFYCQYQVIRIQTSLQLHFQYTTTSILVLF